MEIITPPVALGAFAAASIAGARPMLTGLRAMGLGASTYFIPFFFVLEPALILQGTWQVTVIQVIQVIQMSRVFKLSKHYHLKQAAAETEPQHCSKA